MVIPDRFVKFHQPDMFGPVDRYAVIVAQGPKLLKIQKT
jgi:hypothetical protein